MRSDYIPNEVFNHLLDALTWENRLVLSVCLCTGLRVSDALNLRTRKLDERMTVRELKTGKNRKIRIPRALLSDLRGIAGKNFVFEGRLSADHPRTRQAVFKDLKRAAAAFRLRGVRVAPHTARKIYAVNAYERTCSIEKVRELLNHDNEAVTYLYALADELTSRRLSPSQKKRISRL